MPGDALDIMEQSNHLACVLSEFLTHRISEHDIIVAVYTITFTMVIQFSQQEVP